MAEEFWNLGRTWAGTCWDPAEAAVAGAWVCQWREAARVPVPTGIQFVQLFRLTMPKPTTMEKKPEGIRSLLCLFTRAVVGRWSFNSCN